MSARPSRRRSALLALPLVVGLALAASACSQGGHGQLLLAEDTTVSPDQASAPTATDIWAVDPGDDPTDDDLVATDVSSPLYINDLQEDGSLARDLLATQWSGQVLASFIGGDGSSASATVGTPGDDPVEIATSDSQVQSNILRRGVFVATTDGCKLARSSDDIEDIGTGLCQVSEDERWVVSWPASGGELTIRDLRHDDVRTVEGDTTSAVALGAGSTVLAVQRTDAGSQGVVIDATDGSIIGRTDTFDDLQAMPVEQGSTGFVALAASTSQAATVDATTLLWIGTDAKVRVIDRGALMLPVHTDSEVTYVHFGGQETGTDSIRRWDSASAERQTLLSGAVGAASVGDGRIVATKDTAKGVEIYRSDDHGDLVHATTVPGDATGGSTVSRIFTQGDTSILELTFDGATSLARVDLSGDDSDVPVKRWAAMLLEGIDTDGTVLLSGAEGNTAEQESIGVVTPSSDAFVERTTAASTGLNVIHEGVIYVTDQSEGGLKVRTVRAQGDLDAETLYEGYQVAGTTWPTDNGATQSTLISRVAVLSQQQQAQQRQAQGQAQGQAQSGG